MLVFSISSIIALLSSLKASRYSFLVYCKAFSPVNEIHRDINAANNILERGLKSFGLGISLLDYKQKAFLIS